MHSNALHVNLAAIFIRPENGQKKKEKSVGKTHKSIFVSEAEVCRSIHRFIM